MRTDILISLENQRQLQNYCCSCQLSTLWYLFNVISIFIFSNSSGSQNISYLLSINFYNLFIYSTYVPVSPKDCLVLMIIRVVSTLCQNLWCQNLLKNTEVGSFATFSFACLQFTHVVLLINILRIIQVQSQIFLWFQTQTLIISDLVVPESFPSDFDPKTWPVFPRFWQCTAFHPKLALLSKTLQLTLDSMWHTILLTVIFFTN